MSTPFDEKTQKNWIFKIPLFFDPLGQWIEVGGSDGQQNDIINEILTRRRGDETVTLSMALVVEKLKLGIFTVWAPQNFEFA